VRPCDEIEEGFEVVREFHRRDKDIASKRKAVTRGLSWVDQVFRSGVRALAARQCIRFSANCCSAEMIGNEGGAMPPNQANLCRSRHPGAPSLRPRCRRLPETVHNPARPFVPAPDSGCRLRARHPDLLALPRLGIRNNRRTGPPQLLEHRSDLFAAFPQVLRQMRTIVQRQIEVLGRPRGLHA
jgi:hypothetical protein